MFVIKESLISGEQIQIQKRISNELGNTIFNYCLVNYFISDNVQKEVDLKKELKNVQKYRYEIWLNHVQNIVLLVCIIFCTILFIMIVIIVILISKQNSSVKNEICEIKRNTV